MATRRTLITRGGIFVGLGVLAGCLGDDPPDDDGEPEEDPTDDEEPDEDPEPEHTFEADRLVLTAEQAQGYGEYTTQPGETYRDGETIWVYLEVSNVTPGDGPHLDVTWELQTPGGVALESIDETVTVPDAPVDEPPNETFLTQRFDTSEFTVPSPGEYTLWVELTDRESGETVEITDSVTLVEFEFDTVVFTESEPAGFDDYDENPDATYARGEPVWFYVSVANTPVDSAGTASLEYTFEVETPEGEQWDPIERTEEWERVRPDDILVVWDSFATYEGDPVGEYELTVTVEEQTHEERLRRTETFALE